MPRNEPTTTIDRRFSDPAAPPTPWPDGRKRLAAAEIYWLSTVRPDGRPHVTPLVGVWHDDAFFFCTGADERKALNLRDNPACAVTTGCNGFSEGLDIVVEGQARQITDDTRLRDIAAAYETKYGDAWVFEVRDGRFHDGQNPDGALVYEVAPATGFGFAKGLFGQTRWRFRSDRSRESLLVAGRTG